MNIGTANAQKLDAGFVLNKMDVDRQYSFVTGIVEGLAYSRFLRDRPNEESMKCVTGWFYKDATKKWETIQAVFKRYQDKPPAVLLYVLIKKECGA